MHFVGSLANGPAELGHRAHEGHSGWRIDQLNAHIDAWLRQSDPHTITLLIGTNDIGEDDDLAHAPRGSPPSSTGDGQPGRGANCSLRPSRPSPTPPSRTESGRTTPRSRRWSPGRGRTPISCRSTTRSPPLTWQTAFTSPRTVTERWPQPGTTPCKPSPGHSCRRPCALHAWNRRPESPLAVGELKPLRLSPGQRLVFDGHFGSGAPCVDLRSTQADPRRPATEAGQALRGEPFTFCVRSGQGEAGG